MSELRFDPADPDFIADPYPVYRELRDRAPAFRDEASGLFLITRYADVERATTDYATFSSARGNVPIDSPLRVGKTLGSMDPPRHDELRRIVQRGLGTSRIEGMLPAIQAATRERIEAVRDMRSCDLIADISRPLLFGAIGRLLGLDEAAAVHATELSAGIFHHTDGPMGAVLPPEKFQQIFAFLGEQVRLRADHRGDDVISALLAAKEDGAPLSEEEIVANLSTVLLAGNASMGHFFPNMIHALWLHPDQRRRLLDDPSRIMAAIDESVRWDTSTQSFARQVERDVDVSGTIIPAGSRAIIFYASANRDERAIPDPDRFDIDRQRVRHFGFGMGPHICAGATASRAIMRVILSELLPMLGEYDLDVSKARRTAHVMVRGFVNLPIAW